MSGEIGFDAKGRTTDVANIFNVEMSFLVSSDGHDRGKSFSTSRAWESGAFTEINYSLA